MKLQKISNFFFKTLLTIAIVSSLAQGGVSNAATEGDVAFYRNIQVVSVITDFRPSINKPAHNLEKSLLSWPEFSSKDVDQLVKKILQGQIHSSNPIKIVLSNDISKSDNSGQSEPLELRVKLIYWNGAELMPPINNDIITVSIAVSRVVARNKGFGKIEMAKEEKNSSPYLISVPENRSQFKDSLENSLFSIFQLYAKKINCGNGISEDCTK